MEDNIVIINGKQSDLEQNLIATEKVFFQSTKNNNKNIAYGVVAFILVSAAIAGLYLFATSVDVKSVMKHSSSPQNLLKEEQTEETLTANADAAEKLMKAGPVNYQYVPDTFDVRKQASSLFCNFQVPDEMLCTGGNWSYTISSTISNTVCGQSLRAQEVPLSNQYLLNCSGLSDKCDSLQSVADFESQLQIVSEKGIPTSQCVPYNGLNYNVDPNTCNDKCSDNTDITLKQYNIVSLWDSNDDMQATINNVKSHIYNVGPVIALLRHTATLARYSGSDPNGIFVNDPSDKTFFGYRAYKIVAWNLAPGNSPIPYWTMANTFSSNWGVNGYLNTILNDPIIEGFYGYLPQ